MWDELSKLGVRAFPFCLKSLDESEASQFSTSVGDRSEKRLSNPKKLALPEAPLN